jgi:hypothetical protein
MRAHSTSAIECEETRERVLEWEVEKIPIENEKSGEKN